MEVEDSLSLEDRAELFEQSDDHVIVSPEERETGKVWSCPHCGQDFGTEFQANGLLCPSCGVIQIDLQSEERPLDDEENRTEQSSWSEW